MLSKTSILILFTVTLFFAQSIADDTNGESSSIILNESNFDATLKEKSYLLVNFHALWCKYSKKLKPEWKALEDALKADTTYTVALAQVEAYDEKQLATRFAIEGYPTIKLFINGESHDYHGERTKSQILEFIDRKTKRPLRNVDSSQQVLSYSKEYEWIGILNGVNEADQKVIQDVAFDHDEILFLSTVSGEIADKFGVKTNQFVLISNADGSSSVFSESLNVESVKKIHQR